MTDRPGKEIPKEYREIVAELIDNQRWTYDASGRGYPKLFPADPTQRQISVPKTPSDRRGYRNFVAQIRRAGGTWPPEGKR